jgi:hypothetical protein
VAKVWKSRPTLEGAGVHLKRAFGYSEVPQLDPFLLLDDFHSDDPRHYLAGFPWHPHRGIETITYMREGRVEHGDSMGNSGVITPGDVQWMTAGRGIVHQEMPKGDESNRMWGMQLWANLPAAQKMMPPRYRGITHEEIPEAVLDSGARVKVICGTVGGVSGPVTDVVTDPEYLDVTLPPGTSFRHTVPEGHTVLAYVLEGAAHFDRHREPFAHEVVPEAYFEPHPEGAFGVENLILYQRSGGDVVITTEDTAAQFLLISGRPLGEPVAWYGPIVMNTQEELRVAFEEYEKGTFLKT